MSPLNIIFMAFGVSWIEYALPSFLVLSRTDLDRLNAALRKARRWGITPIVKTSNFMKILSQRPFLIIATFWGFVYSFVVLPL